MSGYTLSTTGNRPRSMTDKLLDAFPRLLREGASISNCCAICGIAVGTYHRWLAEADEPQNTWQQRFRDATATARAEYLTSVERAVSDVAINGKRRRNFKHTTITSENGTQLSVRTLDSESIESSPETALRLLERRDPTNWGRKSTVELSGPGGKPVEVVTVSSPLTPEIYDQLSIDIRRRMLHEYETQQRIADETQLLLSLELRQLGIELQHQTAVNVTPRIRAIHTVTVTPQNDDLQ